MVIKMKKIILDPAHGGSDPGAVGNGLRESDLNLKMGFFIKETLDEGWEDHETIMTRTTDIFPPRSERIAHTNDADRYVELHFNAHGPTAHGFESFIWPDRHNGIRVLPPTVNFQQTVHREIASVMRTFGITDRGDKTGAYIMLGRAQCSALLLEYLFITNAREATIAKNDANLRKMAMATAEGIARDLNLDRKKQTPVPPEIPEQPEIPKNKPEVIRPVGVMIGDRMTDHEAWLLKGLRGNKVGSLGRIHPILEELGIKVTGHGDYIKIHLPVDFKTLKEMSEEDK